MTVCRVILRVVGGITLVAIVLLAFTPLPNVAARTLGAPARLEAADAIVVLGSGVRPGGELTDASLRRALYGVVLYRRGLAPVIVLSGPANRAGIVEARVRADLARTLGVPATAIVTLEEARTTREEARDTAAVLRPRGLLRVLVVSDSLHLVRGVGVFEQAGFVALAAPVDEVFQSDDKPEDRLQLARNALREVVARVYYRLARYY
jgi:uncharacterized SAM-binding protein YcdF (DUF218 family)